MKPIRRRPAAIEDMISQVSRDQLPRQIMLPDDLH